MQTGSASRQVYTFPSVSHSRYTKNESGRENEKLRLRDVRFIFDY
jgi:hypothetical protein